MKYACITLYQPEFPVRLLCRVLEVAPSSYYAWRKRPTRAHVLADERLLLHVRGAHATSGGSYGAPYMHHDLQAAGFYVGKKRVVRLMCTDEPVGTPACCYAPRITDSTHAF